MAEHRFVCGACSKRGADVRSGFQLVQAAGQDHGLSIGTLHRCPAFDFLLSGSLPLRGATSGPAEVGGPGAPHRIWGRLVRWIRKIQAAED